MFKQIPKLFTFRRGSTPVPSAHKLSSAPTGASSHSDQCSVFETSNPAPAPAEAFEKGLLNWLTVDMGLKPAARSGTNARYWSFAYGGHEVHLSVIGPQHNTSTPPAPGIDWILRIEEPEPLAFVTVMAQHFVADSCFKRKMPSGTVRVQFKSSDLSPYADLA